MPYSAEISRTNPSCFLFLIDQSGSMEDSFGGAESTASKSQKVADVINRLLQNLILKCAKSEGVRDYFHVGLFGYGNDGVVSALSGALEGKELIVLSELSNNPVRIEERPKKIEDGAGGLVEKNIKFPIWLEPKAVGGTPMCQAMEKVGVLIRDWLYSHCDCYPPTIINITDGESTDGDPTPHAQTLCSLSSSDGQVLLYNIHLSSRKGSPIPFPDSEEILPDDYARLLFRISSRLPDNTRSFAQREGFVVSENTRGFLFNADAEALIRFLEIGTRPSNLR